MQVLNTRLALENALISERNSQKKIGFVPTMGALHEGHLSLVAKAREKADIVVVSIFVNPTQFNNQADLENYPRVPDADTKLLQAAHVDYLFLPDVDTIYPDGLKSGTYDFGTLETVMEGAFRPGHFGGVAEVVKRFFELIRPDLAFFGEKDFQQLLVIKALLAQLDLRIVIIAVPTERSEKGLALSSRNKRLSPQQKEDALIIVNSMRWVADEYTKLTISELREGVKQRFADSNLKLEYVQIANANNLSPVIDGATETPARIFIAAFVGAVRLIDNLPLN
jgi:pantoate--beta-alanine ligase